jgi:hypothetical protein
VPVLRSAHQLHVAMMRPAWSSSHGEVALR